MEVSSSTATSSSQEDGPDEVPQTTNTLIESQDAGPQEDGLNNTVSIDFCVGNTEMVRYGPSMPPNYYQTESVSYSKDIRDSKAVHGSCGLYNLGNTCFMNSGLQSLMACAPLVKFFSEQFTLNETNSHTLAGNFSILLCKMWSGQFSVVHPRKFKDFLGFYHSQFEDFRQHDCQEFLALLLDTLHEQLNEATAANNNGFTATLYPSPSLNCPSPPVKKDCAASGVSGSSSATSSSHSQSKENSTAVSDLNNRESGVCASVTGEADVGSECSVVENGREGCEASSSLSSSSPLREVPATSFTGSEAESHLVGFRESSPRSVATSEVSMMDCAVASPASHGDSAVARLVDDEDGDEITSSSFSPLKRYTSRSNLEDVSSSDTCLVVKPSLKRVSSGGSVTASGLVFASEDSNHSSVSVHSTDSEQSSAFKRLKIDAAEINKNGNNNLKECVTSSSDCRKGGRGRKNMVSDGDISKGAENVVAASSSEASSIPHKDLNIIDNIVSSCSHLDTKMENAVDGSQSVPSLDDFYSKETKTLNTNVLVSEFLQEITSDSEKFAKVDNRSRPPSKEINILQEAFEEEDKAEKVLIGQRLGFKDTNLFAQSPSLVRKPVKNSNPNVLNNSQEEDLLSLEAVSKGDLLTLEAVSKLDVSVERGMEEAAMLSLKLSPEASHGKLEEEEKNVQMQAYTKFNTIPAHSNIRTDLTDKSGDVDSMDVDEVEVESSDEEELDLASQTSTVEECSSVPNCLRHCERSEVTMANRAWEDYKSRNDSIIVSTFQGQFRSTVVCSECSHVSVTYEPFMYLSLPIPHAMDQQLCVVHISCHKPPTRYLLNLRKTDKVGTAKKKLKELISQEEGDVIMAEVLDGHISRLLDDNILLKYVNTQNRKIYSFEIVSMESEEGPSQCQDMPILNNDDNISSKRALDDPSSSGPTAETDVSYLIEGPLSNHSFDSVNVNSPSSRDTLDYVFSDSEACEATSYEPTNASPFVGQAASPGLCQSTCEDAGGFSNNPWIAGVISSPDTHSSNSKANPVRDEGDYEEGREAASTDLALPALYPCSVGEDGDSVTPVSEVKLEVGGCIGDHQEVFDTSRIELGGVESPSPSFSGALGSNEVEGGMGDHYAAAHSGGVSVSSSSNSSNKISSSSTVVAAAQSPVLSRSCPSPVSFSPSTSSHNATLVDVAARLHEAPGFFRMQGPREELFSRTGDENCPMRASSSRDDDCFRAKPRPRSSSWSGASLHEKVSVRASKLSGSRSPTLTQHLSPAPCRPEAVTETSAPGTEEEWRSCAICLEDLVVSELLTHVSCDGVFCHNCLEMSVKHTADVAAFCCPICLQPANLCEDFVPLGSACATKPKIRTLPMCIAYRCKVRDNTGRESLQLLGHPNIVHVPSVVSGSKLYTLVDSLLHQSVMSYSILLTDGQGLTCASCQYSSHCTGCEISRDGEVTLQPSDCLTVHLCQEEPVLLQPVVEDASMAGLRSSEPTTIMDCFGAFTQSEILDEHNPWYCPQCERNQCAKKTMTVWRYPDNLIIHLKRFVYQDLSSTKVDTKVIFPDVDMDVRGFLSGPSSPGLVYNLYSIVCHFGGASSGHYTCLARHPLTNQWFYYNDETVTLQAPSESEYSSGYVLFYQRQGTEVTFTPPQSIPSLEEEGLEMAAVTSSSITTTTSRSISNNNFSGSNSHGNSMALVLFQPPSSSKVELEEEEDCSEGRRIASLEEESLTVHFESAFPYCEDRPALEPQVAEPDSTHDFYS